MEMLFRLRRRSGLTVHQLTGAVLKCECFRCRIGHPIFVLVLEALQLARNYQIRQRPHVARHIGRLVIRHPSGDVLTILLGGLRKSAAPAMDKAAWVKNLGASDSLKFAL